MVRDGDAYSASPINADLSPLQVWPRARDAVAHATASGPSLPEVQTSLDYSNSGSTGLVAAEAAFRKSIALDPSYSLATGFWVSSSRTWQDTKRRHWRFATHATSIRLTPLTMPSRRRLRSRRVTIPRSPVREQAITIDPEFWIGYIQLAQVYERLGNTDLALNALNNAGASAAETARR